MKMAQRIQDMRLDTHLLSVSDTNCSAVLIHFKDYQITEDLLALIYVENLIVGVFIYIFIWLKRILKQSCFNFQNFRRKLKTFSFLVLVLM